MKVLSRGERYITKWNEGAADHVLIDLPFDGLNNRPYFPKRGGVFMDISYDAGKAVEGSGWISLHKNENHFIPSDWFQRDLSNICSAHYAWYPDPFSLELRERLAELYGVDITNIYIGNGSDGVLADVFSLMRRQYDKINLPNVGYKVYDILAGRLNFHVNRYASSSNGPEAGSFSGLSVIDSPNAITGSRAMSGLVEETASIASNFVIWDNCYGDFENKNLNVGGKLSGLAVIRSFSKYYGLAGLRIGYCIAAPEVIASLTQWKDIYNVNVVAQSMAARALQSGGEFSVFSSRMLQAREALQKHLCSLGFNVVEPHGNFIFACHPGVTGTSLQARLEASKILVRRFEYPETSNWLRITVPSEADLDQVCEAFASTVAFDNGMLLSAGE